MAKLESAHFFKVQSGKLTVWIASELLSIIELITDEKWNDIILFLSLTSFTMHYIWSWVSPLCLKVSIICSYIVKNDQCSRLNLKHALDTLLYFHLKLNPHPPELTPWIDDPYAGAANGNVGNWKRRVEEIGLSFNLLLFQQTLPSRRPLLQAPLRWLIGRTD